MSTHENDVIERLHALAEGFDMPIAPLADDVRRGRSRIRRNRVMATGAVAAAVALILGVTAALSGQDRTDGSESIVRPEMVAGAVPVWYDANGLHRGDVVEQVPVEIFKPEEPVEGGGVISAKGALALVRTGALYLEHATRDVWFHPWDSEPRVVGHNSAVGPGGDPFGDIAVWFEGSDALNATPGDLVVYDTAAGREISRTRQAHGVTEGPHGDHYPAGSGFLEVTDDRIVWITGSRIYSYELATETTSVIKGFFADVQNGIEVTGGAQDLRLNVPGRPEATYPDLESHVRLSPSGNYLLAVEGTETRHAAAIVDTRTGELWRVPKNAYPWISWSYGDIAVIDVEDELLACDAVRQVCETLEAERPFLLPTN